MTSNVKLLDPVKGLVEYVLDVKPYHTKIMEVLVEYVYNEAVDITISDEHHFKIDLFQPTPGELLLACNDGYSVRPYGDPGRHPVVSPSQSVTFENYPAISNFSNSVIVPGDVSTSINYNDTVYITSFVETIISGVDASLSTFILHGDHTSDFLIGTIFAVTGSYQYDKYYSAAIDSTFDGNDTTITVVQTIEPYITNSALGLVQLPGNNSGTYTVVSAIYNHGMIDSWPNMLDPASYVRGDSPHTIITVSEPLNSIPTLDDNQIYTASVSIDPILINEALGYSNFIETYDPAVPLLASSPDEGFVTLVVTGLTTSTLDGLGFPIPDTGNFSVDGDLDKSNVYVGDILKISRSVGNNGTYTISSISYNAGADETTFGVEELVDSSTLDGYLTIDMASNVFIVDGDHTNRFTQGVQFEIVGGNKSGVHTTLTSDYVNSNTRIRVFSNIFQRNLGYLISSSINDFVVAGDVTTIFPALSQFNVIGSTKNDGSYNVAAAGSTFDSNTGETTIPVDVAIDPTSGGYIHLYQPGFITEKHYGFAETSNVCGYAPPTLVSVFFDEKLHIGGQGPATLNLYDDVIAYNLENSDVGSFDMPANTIVSTTQPNIPEQLSAPAEELNALWFDTNTDTFKQYNGYKWHGITTAWWFDTTNDLLYYLKKNGTYTDYGSGLVQVDTGWILDFYDLKTDLGAPGYNTIAPAIGEIEYLDDQTFIVTDLGSGVAQDTFILDTIIPEIPPVPANGTIVSLLSVTINGVFAEFILNSSTSFTIVSPQFIIGDVVHATVYSRTANETNARVIPMSVEPHTVYHDFVEADTVNNAYVIGGGNFIDRFKVSSSFDVMIEGISTTQSVFLYNIEQFSIIDVNGTDNTITIVGDYLWLFTNNRVFEVQSENNYNEFIVDNSILNTDNNTVIAVQNTVYEIPTLYNPGISIYNIDNITNTIIVLGNVVDAYTAGMIIRVSDSTTDNNGDWTVGSGVSDVTYDDINDRTNIIVDENIPDPDPSTNAFIYLPISQNYSRDLGVVWGAVFEQSSIASKQPTDIGYDPLIDGIYNIGMTKTIVVPTTAVIPDITGIVYNWNGPIRMELSTNKQDDSGYTIQDHIGVSDELLAIPDTFQILNTSATDNYFIIGYDDPITSLPVNLTSGFPTRAIFDVKGSYSNNSPISLETNDAKYIVSRTFFDDVSNVFTATGGETKIVWDNLYTSSTHDMYKNGVLLVEDVDYSVTGVNEICIADPTDCPTIGIALVNGDVLVQLPINTPIAWATGSGENFIEIDTEYDNIPPYNNFNVVNVNNNAAELSTIVLSGNHVTLFEQIIAGVFRLDIPLVSVDQIYNVITVVDVVLDGSNDTVLTVQEEFIDENYTGDLGIIDVAYSGDVFFDATNATLPWVHGTIFRKSFRIDQVDATKTAAAIDDQLIFGWGTIIQWDIVVTDRSANFETIDIDGNPATTDVRLYRGSLSIDGDQTTTIELNDRFSIRGSDGNDGDYEVATKSYDVGNDDTVMTPRNQPTSYEITTNTDIAGSLNNTYFYVYTPSDKYYVWMDIDNTGTDPAIANMTGVEVHVPIDASADTIAINIEYALTKTGAFIVSYNSNVVSIDVITSGIPLAYAIDIDTGFTVDNYTLSSQPEPNLQGIFELSNVDVTDWFQYLIQQMDPVTNNISVIGNATGDIQNGQQIRVINTNNNDGIFTISALPTYDASTATTITPVTEIISYGTNEIVEVISLTQLKTIGNCANFLDGDDIINIVNSTENDGTYTIIGVEYERPYSIITISTSLTGLTADGDVEYVDRGGWIEAVRYQGINMFYGDVVGVTATEFVDAALLTTGLSFVDSWDAVYWDVGSYDETLGTVIHLYSNTF